MLKNFYLVPILMILLLVGCKENSESKVYEFEWKTYQSQSKDQSKSINCKEALQEKKITSDEDKEIQRLEREAFCQPSTSSTYLELVPTNEDAKNLVRMMPDRLKLSKEVLYHWKVDKKLDIRVKNTE